MEIVSRADQCDVCVERMGDECRMQDAAAVHKSYNDEKGATQSVGGIISGVFRILKGAALRKCADLIFFFVLLLPWEKI